MLVTAASQRTVMSVKSGGRQ